VTHGFRQTAIHALYLSLSLLFASRFFPLTHPTTHAFADGDPALAAWIIQWESHALVTDPLRLYAGNTFYPYDRSIVLSDPFLTLAVLNVPVRAFTANPWVGYNLLLVLSYYLSAVYGGALARTVTGSQIAGVWGGVFFGFLFYRVHHFGHLQIISCQWIPAAILCLMKVWQRPRVRSALLFAMVFAAQALVSWYLAVILAVILAIVVLTRPAREILRSAFVRQYALSAVVALAIVVPFALPYRAAFIGTSLAERSRAVDVTGDAVRIRDYLTPPDATLAGRFVPDNPYSIWRENTLYIGMVPLALAAIAIAAAGRRRESVDRHWIGAGLAMMLAGYVLALGFVSPGWGVRLPLWYAARVGPALAALRATQRFSIVIYVGVLLLSSIGVARLTAGRSRRWQTTVTIALIVTFLIEVFPARLPFGTTYRYAPSAPDRFIATYQHTRTTPLVVLHLPIHYFLESYATEEATYMVDSTWHWARILNGFSGAEPNGFMDRMRALNTLPSMPRRRTAARCATSSRSSHGRESWRSRTRNSSCC
jgi:hypothetical protein